MKSFKIRTFGPPVSGEITLGTFPKDAVYIEDITQLAHNILLNLAEKYKHKEEIQNA